MKNKIILFITIILICIFPTYIFAEEENKTYTNLNISSIITTSVNMDEIDRFNIKYRVYTSPDKYKDEEIVLIRSDEYSSKKYYQSITNVSFISGYAIAKDGTVDKYGFINFKPNVNYNDENSTITLELQVTFNDMGFDGRNFRKNSDISDEYIEERKKGIALKDSEITTKNSTGPTTIPTTASPEKQVINEKTTSNTKNENKKVIKNSNKALEYIIIISIILIGIVSVFVLVKYNASKKRV